MAGRVLLEIRDLKLGFPNQEVTTFRDSFVNWIKRAPRNNRPTAVLNGVNLTLHEGDRLAVLGANGQGKTTLCRCVAGLYRPHGGRIHHGGRVRAIFDPSTGFYPDLTGEENADFMLPFLYPTELDARAELKREALAFSELGSALKRPVRYYSRGMRVRLALSLATLRSAEILILDEVLNGADLSFQAKIAERMATLVRDSGAVIFVSHSLEQIRWLCNRAVILANGKVSFDGSVRDGLMNYCMQYHPSQPGPQLDV